MKLLFFVTLAILTSCSGQQITPPSNEQDYEVTTMTIHGIDCSIYCHYTVSNKVQIDCTLIRGINQRLGEELSKISDESTVKELIEAIDTIGPIIKSEIKDEFDLVKLEVLNIGVEAYIKEGLIQQQVNIDKVKAITSDEMNNHFSSLVINSKEKSKSEYLSLNLRTKNDWEVQIEYAIYYLVERGLGNPIDSLNRHIESVIIDSLRQFDMREMLMYEQESMETIMTRIIKTTYPESNRVVILTVEIPEEAERQFMAIDELKDSLMQKSFEIHKSKSLLKQKLEKNNDLSESEVIEIEKEINALESELKLIQEKEKLLTYEYKP